MKKKCIILLLLLTVFGIDCVNGQTLIGNGEVPVQGAILQLQNLPDNDTNLVNANKGLLLPRVNLTDINNLYPMFSVGYDKTMQDLAHSGLMVFNINENLFKGDGNGVYLWDGLKWNGLGLIPRKINVSPKIVYLSKNKKTGMAEVTPSVKGLQWDTSIDGVVNSSTMTSEVIGDITKMTFLRSDTSFGNKTYKFALKTNPDRITELQVANLELTINTPLFKVGQGVSDGLVQSQNAVTAHGGQEKWEVISYSENTFNWTIPPKLENGKLIFQLGDAKMVGNVDGEIIVGHMDDKSLTGKIVVRQNADFVRLPDFDYVVASVVAQDRGMNPDYVFLCLLSEVRGTGNPEVDYKFVGYEKYDSANHSPVIVRERYAKTNKTPSTSVRFLTMSNHKEGYYNARYAILDMSLLAKDILTSENNREFRFQSRATWFWPKSNADEDNVNRITITYTFYKGGTITWNATGEYPILNGAVEVKKFTKKDVNLRKFSGNSYVSDANDREKYTQPLYEIEYDFVEKAGLFLPMQ